MFIRFFVLSVVFHIAGIAIQASSDGEVLYYHTYCKVKNGKLSVKKDVWIQINNRSGDRYSDIKIHFSEGDDVNIENAQVETITGKVVRKLKKNQITEVSAISDFSLYEDDFVKEFSLQHTQYPYRIRYSYEIEYDNFLHIISWNPVFSLDVPTQMATLWVEIPENYDIKVNQKLLNEPQIVSNGSILTYKWKSSYTKQLIKEVYSPSLVELIPNVQVVPSEFNYGVYGSFESWESFGNWHYRLIQSLDNNISKEDQNRVDNILSTTTDTLDIIKKLYYFLQKHTRYINVSIDIGGLKPYPAEYVSSTGYGDCKALTNYLKTLLDYAGIKSYYTKVYAGIRPPRVKSDFPSQQFNHIILMIPLNNDSIWLDCTSDISPVNYLGTFTQNRKALPIDEAGSKLICTPGLTYDEVHSICNYLYDMRLLNNPGVQLHYLLRGHDFEVIENFRVLYNESDKDRIIREIFPISNFELNQWNIHRVSHDEPQVILTAELELTRYTKDYGTNAVFDLVPSRIPKFEKPEKRTLPVWINYPIYQTDSIEYIIPEDYFLAVIPENLKIVNQYGSYEIQYTVENSRILVAREFILHPGEYDVDEYVEFYNFMDKIYESEQKSSLMITKK